MTERDTWLGRHLLQPEVVIHITADSLVRLDNILDLMVDEEVE
jgi:hypothetical protein